MTGFHFVRAPATSLNDKSDGRGRGAPSRERDWNRKYGLRAEKRKWV